MALVLSVNVGQAQRSAPTSAPSGLTGIDKQPVPGPVEVRDPGPKGTGGSGLTGDAVCDRRHHGGSDQAVYAYAREDLDFWEAQLGRRLACGVFGENLTTLGLDLTGALVGERWQVGTCVLQVTDPRIPCRTFAGWLAEAGWVRRFKHAGTPGAYLRVVTPGLIQAGDTVEVISRPAHGITMGLAFQAHTTKPELLPRLLEAGEALTEEARRSATRGVA
jgi:MOSC domain-containing protein YiiM